MVIARIFAGPMRGSSLPFLPRVLTVCLGWCGVSELSSGKKHRTYHAAEASDGFIAVGCSCGWTGWVAVSDLTWVEAMEAIYAERDKHEKELA